MDTAQRGMGLDWAATQELIKRSGAERPALAVGRRERAISSCGAGTDQLDLATLPAGPAGLARLLDAYREQIDVVTEAGAQVILMASRALAQVAQRARDYLYVYETLLAGVDRPVILHWLGTMFDPALDGYWGSADVATATETFRTLIASKRPKIDGVKVSLLDAAHEVALRRALPDGVRLYTGDDFNYPELIVGDGTDIRMPCSASSRRSTRPRPPRCRTRQRQRGARAQILGATRELGAHLRRPDVLLQDRDRVPVLAQR